MPMSEQDTEILQVLISQMPGYRDVYPVFEQSVLRTGKGRAFLANL